MALLYQSELLVLVHVVLYKERYNMNMKNYTFIFCCIAMLSLKSAFAQLCPDTSDRYNFSFGGNQYILITEEKSMADANLCAADLGGHLVYINSQAEQDTVYNSVSAAGVSAFYTTVTDGGGIAYIWIGATDELVEGDWTWGQNGSTFWSGEGAAGAGGGSAVNGAYINWGGTSNASVNEPDDFNGAQDGGAMALDEWPSGSSNPLGVPGEWNDINDSNKLYYVVEIEGTGVENTLGESNISPLVYPNPVSNVLTIDLSQSNVRTGSLSLINTVGQVVEHQTINKAIINLDVERIPSGIYILKVDTEQGDYRQQVLIQ